MPLARTRKRRRKRGTAARRRPIERRPADPARILAGVKGVDTPEKRKLYDLIRERPRQLSVLKQLAGLMRKDGDHAAAAALLRAGLALQPGDRDVQAHLARTYCESGDVGRAIALYRKLIRLNPDDPIPYEKIDRICRDRGMIEEAVRLYRAIPAGGALKERGHERLHFLLVEKLRDFPRGIANLREAIARFGPSYRRCKELGRLYAKRRNWRLAAGCYREALGLKGDDADLVGMLGWALAESGDPRGAEECFRKISGTFQGGASLAEIRLRQGRLGEAEEALNALAARYAGNSRVAIGRAELALRRGDASAARALCGEAMKRTPPYFAFELAHGHEVLAGACKALGEKAAAAHHGMLAAALKGGPDTYTALADLGEGKLGGGDLDAAELVLGRLLELYPGNTRALAGICEIRMRRGDPRGAVLAGEEALANANPKYRDEQIRCHKALDRAYRLLKDDARARRHRARAGELGRAGGQ